ncbi:MAG: galactokinase [Actinomycetota bacterium]|nr:galactokinase [Actinomycetota bacterium]
MTVHWYPLPSRDDATGAATAAFRAAFGREPDGLWAAPGRVNLIGEHVDYQAGLCLPFALPQRTVVAIATRDDDLLRLRSAQLDGSGDTWEGRIGEIRPGSVPGWAGYGAGVPWALRADGFDVPGADVLVDGSVPLGAGLSSSAALECALALALDDVAGLGLATSDAGRARLAAACVRAENEIAGAPTGGMDQAAALRCRAGHALLLDCRDFGATQVPFDLAGAGLELLVTDTRAHHALVDGRYGSRRDTCARAAASLGVTTLREIPGKTLDSALAVVRDAALDAVLADELCRCVRHVVTEIDRVTAVATLLREGRLREIGPLLDASHRSLRDDYQVSCAELDVACEATLAAGALGARMTGGGFGGSAIALVEAADTQTVAKAVADAFAARGWDHPIFLRAVPDTAGERLR